MTRTVLVTGATAGFGEATARRFAKDGWNIIITGRRADRLDKLRQELGAERVHASVFDIRDAGTIDAALAALPDRFRGVDVLVNNAPVWRSARLPPSRPISNSGGP
jgi:serine 3-dehydrogenase (NADP+)